MRKITRVRGPLLLAAILGLSETVQAGLRLEPANVLVSVDVVAAGLNQPAGLTALPGQSGIVVAERGANRITVIHDKQTYPLVNGPIQIDADTAPAAGAGMPDGSFWTTPALRAPCAVTFDAHGALYIAESGTGGRILKLEKPNADHPDAQIIRTPWMNPQYGFTSLRFDAADRLFATAAKDTAQGGLPFGNVLMRDPEQTWWMIDFGPFAEFGHLVIDPSGRFMAVAERRAADICWYNMRMETQIAEVDSLEGLRDITFLKDGTTLATLEKKDKTWSLVEVDPFQERIKEWVGELSAIGGLYTHPDSGAVYLSLTEEGKVIRVKRLEHTGEVENKLARLQKKFEREKWFPPDEWPDFFKPFISGLDVVHPVDSAGAPASRQADQVYPLTMAQFARSLPLIAAKLKAHPVHPEQVEDPIEEIHFILFSPRSSMVTHRELKPNMSLFYARHRSGKVRTTSFMNDLMGLPINPQAEWQQMPKILLSTPTGIYVQNNTARSDDLVEVNFVGVFNDPNYYIDLFRDESQPHRMDVEITKGKLVAYILEPYRERPEAGGTSILLANLADFRSGWMNLGHSPVDQLLNPDPVVFADFRHSKNVREMMDRDVIMRTAYAPDFKRQTTRMDLKWPRQVVQRAAVHWRKDPF